MDAVALTLGKSIDIPLLLAVILPFVIAVFNPIKLLPALDCIAVVIYDGIPRDIPAASRVPTTFIPVVDEDVNPVPAPPVPAAAPITDIVLPLCDRVILFPPHLS